MYRGETFRIDCSRGGLNGSINIDAIPPFAMLYPSRNLNLHRGVREKRGGTSYVNSAAYSGAPTIRGVFDFTLQNATQYIIAACSDGKVYRDGTNTIKTGMSTANYFDFEVGDNKLFICDKATTPQVWTGTGNTADITSSPTDWATNKPFQMIKHGYGNSERMWAFTYLSVYASEDGDMQDFSDANVISIPIDTGEHNGIVGAVEYGDRIIVFGRRQAFIIVDTATSTDSWGYSATQWEGGVAHWRLIVKTPNDIVCMMEDGEIYSVTAAENYGDYKAASLTRPSFMHQWIQDNVRLGYINDFHAVYDPVMRAILFFVVRQGYTYADTALVYFIDRPPEEAWSIHDNQGYNSGYRAASSGLIRKATGNYKVYTGDITGNLWELETANANDEDNPYYGGFKIPSLTFDNPRIDKRFDMIRIITQPEGSYNLAIKWWVDGKEQTAGTVSLAGSGGVLDSFTLGTSLLGGGELLDTFLDLGAVGKRIQAEVYNSSLNQTFKVSQVLIDFKQLGAHHG